MADARTLLRQQRAARRITHPQAFYSDAGTLICKLCRERVRAESQWDDHVRSRIHLQKQSEQQQSQRQSIREADADRSPRDPAEAADSGKRKLENEDGDHANHADTVVSVQGEKARAGKRIRPDRETDAETPPKAGTPPALARRASTTPSQGIELQIPSRPATPGQGGNSTQTPQSHRRNESVSSHMNGERGLPSRQNSTLLASANSSVTTVPAPARPISQEELPSASTTHAATGDASQEDQVNEAEWAAFQADLATVPPQEQQPNPESTIYHEATISAAPMTAAESRAQREREADLSVNETNHKFSEREVQRREGERDDAMRALELEFEEMEDYEQRVRRLKERKEQLESARERKAAGLGELPKGETIRIEQIAAKVENHGNDEDDEADDDDDDDDDDDEDEWEGFRIRR